MKSKSIVFLLTFSLTSIGSSAQATEEPIFFLQGEICEGHAEGCAEYNKLMEDFAVVQTFGLSTEKRSQDLAKNITTPNKVMRKTLI